MITSAAQQVDSVKQICVCFIIFRSLGALSITAHQGNGGALKVEAGVLTLCCPIEYG